MVIIIDDPYGIFYSVSIDVIIADISFFVSIDVKLVRVVVIRTIVLLVGNPITVII